MSLKITVLKSKPKKKVYPTFEKLGFYEFFMFPKDERVCMKVPNLLAGNLCGYVHFGEDIKGIRNVDLKAFVVRLKTHIEVERIKP